MFILVMVLSFAVSLLLLLGVDRLFSQSMQLVRGMLAAGIGGVYAGLCLLPGLGFLGGLFLRMAVLLGIGYIAYGWSVKELSVFTLLNLAIGGGRIWSVLSAVFILVFTLKNRRGCVPVVLQLGGKVMEFSALRDTGNTLIDPLSGKRVLVVGADIAREMLGLTLAELQNPVGTLEERKDTTLRLIPYSAVGVPSGMLLAARPQSLKIGKRQRGDLVAFAPQILGTSYKALAGGI